MMNNERADGIAGILTSQFEMAEDMVTPTEALTDLLADARHFAWGKGIEFAECLRLSETHFEDELALEAEGGEQR